MSFSDFFGIFVGGGFLVLMDPCDIEIEKF